MKGCKNLKYKFSWLGRRDKSRLGLGVFDFDGWSFGCWARFKFKLRV